MPNRFEEIPECVWKLFDEIMWASAPKPVTLTPDERTNAYMFAWGYDPPLMKLGEQSQLTAFGLAAYAQHDDQRKNGQNKSAEHSAVWEGNGVVRIDGKPIKLEGQEAAVIESLVNKGAATLTELQKDSGYADAVKILKKIVEKFDKAFEPYIFFPGGRGQGGYRTTIQKAGG